MTTLSRLNGKFMEEKLKRGFGISYFLKNFNVSEEEFYKHLKKTFSSKAYTSMCKRLKSNEKKFASKVSKATDSQINTAILPTEKVEDIEVVNNVECETIVSLLDTLKKDESTLTKVICSEEAAHAKLISKRAVLKTQFQKQRDQLIELTQEIEIIKNSFEETFSEWEKLGLEMHSLTESISEKKATLESIRKEISSLEKISIFAYANGEIEFENLGEFDTTIEQSSEAEVFNELIQNNNVESLTIKNIRQLSKLILIVKKLNSEQHSFDLTFEDSTMQEVFNSISIN